MTDYIGFSTIDRLSPPYTLTDIDLVKRDLLNEFHTRLGDRVMQPEFGTIIYDLLMDPADDVTKDAIYKDALRIVTNDPRVQLIDVNVTDHQDVIMLHIDLLYNPHKVRDSLYVTYQTNAGGNTTAPTLLQ